MSTIIIITRPPTPNKPAEPALEYDVSIPAERQDAHDAIDRIAGVID